MLKQIDIFGNEIDFSEIEKKEALNRKRYKTMQQLHGIRPGTDTCKTCKHCIGEFYHGRTYYKCELWYISNSEATDIRLKNQACNKYESEE